MSDHARCIVCAAGVYTYIGLRIILHVLPTSHE